MRIRDQDPSMEAAQGFWGERIRLGKEALLDSDSDEKRQRVEERERVKEKLRELWRKKRIRDQDPSMEAAQGPRRVDEWRLVNEPIVWIVVGLLQILYSLR
ncbi:unnamed protein product [Microthlaspi erraticum]|uniref:Uncharacterized protein n=1 Tax=Microthlaspi erraticum TaxID=1685480 RepID=A0A6D2K3U4_9BRAS|nr:unnamed protein product [Microthlaspi erraticum]